MTETTGHGSPELDADAANNSTTKPWAPNRNGDPRQLLHEAEHILEPRVRASRREANRLRKLADHEDRAANIMEEAARDYRQWAKERSAESV